jgi:DNA-binding FadR family transcriptional regulator
MSTSRLIRKPGPTAQELAQQNELFQLLQDSHLRWMEQESDDKIREMHLRLADVFQVLMEQYEALVKALQKRQEEK